MPFGISLSRCLAVYHPSLNLFARATPATLNLYATSKESISLVGDAVEKRCLIPPKPDVPSVLITLNLLSTQTLRESERLSSPFSMVENSSYLQNKNWLRKVFKYYLLHAVAPDYRIESLRDYPYSRSSCPLRGLQLVRIMSSPRIMVSKLDDLV